MPNCIIKKALEMVKFVNPEEISAIGSDPTRKIHFWYLNPVQNDFKD